MNDFQEYINKAMAFAKFQPTKDLDLIHAALGIVSDTGEVVECISNGLEGTLDKTNLIEEIGDVAWFTALALHTTGTDITVFYNCESKVTASSSHALQLSLCGSYVADMVKAKTIYLKPIDLGVLEDHLFQILQCLSYLSRSIGESTFEQVLEANIAKLTARYGAKYDQDKALNRDKEAERLAIEGVRSENGL